jgi:hypothetical protein
VDVFRYARGDWLLGLGGGIYHGVSAVEIKTVAEILGRPCNEDLLWRLKVLESSFGKEKNRQQQQRRSKK